VHCPFFNERGAGDRAYRQPLFTKMQEAGGKIEKYSKVIEKQS
jgi:hypothetical protein